MSIRWTVARLILAGACVGGIVLGQAAVIARVVGQ